MNINSVGIAGLGLIGGSLAKSIRSEYPSVQIFAYDYPNVLTQAISQNIIDVKTSAPNDLLKCDLIFLSLPIFESLNLFNELYPQLNENQIISDLCSVKKIFTDASIEIKSKGKYIGLHPMAGKEKSGFENSDQLLFENAICFVCDENKNMQTEAVLDFLNCTGLRFTFIDAELHDRIASEVSHLPQLISVTLINSVSKSDKGFNFLNFAGSGFRDMTRIASSDFSIWEQILKANKRNIINALDSFLNELSNLKEKFKDDNFLFLKEKFFKANESRNEIPFNNKGFIQPLFDLTVFLKDEPGSLSKLTTALFKNKINIKDIELLKIREGSGGNFRLYFESAEELERANHILEQNNFITNFTK